MNTHTLYPRLLVVASMLFFTIAVTAQSSEVDPRQTTTAINANIRLETEVATPAVPEERRPRIVNSVISVRPAPVVPAISLANDLDRSLLTSIQSHLGATYRFNRTGPDQFDCSGLVWRAFQDIGVSFQRGPARSYWATFAAPRKDEEFKFGTLVFFSNLRHVGIVVDEKGFYHSARHGGVMYSTFNDYWLSRIDGFRRVPAGALPLPAAKAKPRPATKSVAVATVEEDNEP